ncbi:MAG TPA: class I SAM-dependent rRNA methyltransferase, partial [Spirochaetales bacterium]|nr:class I SAM-dependent rRNA methyltransferase [Spirochaetales bacterium]
MKARAVATLKPKEENRLLLGHPWAYDNEIASVSGNPQAGSEVSLRSARGKNLGTAIWSPVSKIRARRYTWADEELDGSFIRAAVAKALARRAPFRDTANDSMRAVFAEADGLPGLIVDRFVGTGSDGSKGSWLSVQILCAGMDARRELILDALKDTLRPDGIMERSDAPVRSFEGLPAVSGVVAGSVPERIQIIENGLRFSLCLGHGQKTGWFLDQRENRAASAAWARGKAVLDVFSNAGGFALAAAKAGAESVLAVDSSADAIAELKANAALNGLQGRVSAVEANAFDWLREAQARKEHYGLVILDPPAFAKNKASLDGAMRGYKEINLRALHLLEDGGILASFSCSFWLSRDRFRLALESAAADAHVNLRYLDERGQAPDHPVLAGYPESSYLKGCVVQV